MRRVALEDVRLELLQTFRLSHAMAEAGVPISVRREHADRWQWLSRYFPGLDWSVSRFARRLSDVTVDHAAPETRIGGVGRPLVFAHAILERCHEMWSDRREHRMTFAGLMTEQRRETLDALVTSFGDDFEVIATDAGRRWPTKAWDDDYYAMLGASQLTACPDGNYVWTYRFFEAAMCGSIPVIQNDCEHYDGFHFYRMTDDPTSMVWRSDWVEQNARRARELLTIPRDEIRAAVKRAR